MLNILSKIFALEGKGHLLPLIWLMAAGLILSKMPMKYEVVCGRNKKNWYTFSAILLVLPLIFWAGFRGYIGDTFAYRRHFANAPSSISALLATLNADTKDPGFEVLITLVKSLGVSDYRIFFLIISTFQMLAIALVFRKYSPSYWISVFLFVVSTDYLSWMFNGMRQFIAVTMIFGATGLLLNRRYKTYIAVVLLAAQIHGSAILMLPLAYVMTGAAMNWKTLLMIVGVAAVVPFIDRLMPMANDMLADTQYSTTMTDEIWTVDDGTNPIRVLVYSVPALVALFGRKYIIRANDPVMNLCVNASMITMAIYLVSMVTSGIYVGRLPIYTTLYGYMSLPWIIDTVFERESARFITVLMIVCYLGFFYIQMHSTWGYF